MDHSTDYSNYPPPPPPRPRNDLTTSAVHSHGPSIQASPASTMSRTVSARDATHSSYTRPFGTVEQTPIAQCARVYFTRRDLLEAAPDDPVRAAEARVQWCRFIGQVCRACGFPLTTTSTAMMLYHRFYAVHSLSAYSPQDASVACIFVACKVEETLKRLRDILAIALQLQRKDNQPIDMALPEFESHRQKIINLERLVLQALCFDFRVRHPGGYVIKFVQRLQGSKELAYKAWTMTIESFFTTLPLQYPPHLIAVGAVEVAQLVYPNLRLLQRHGKKGNAWWKSYYCRRADVLDVCLQLVDYYCANNTNELSIYQAARDRIQRRIDRAAMLTKRPAIESRNDADAKRQRVLAAGKQDTIRYVVHPQQLDMQDSDVLGTRSISGSVSETTATIETVTQRIDGGEDIILDTTTPAAVIDT
ncbi:cyclin-like protein [Syncephalis fuscata]|nr:cyclin-like protein [Syncephalis fuscata]